MADPLDLSTLDDLQFQTGRRVDPVVASPGAVLEALGLRESSGLDQLVASLPEELRAERELEGGDLERATRAAPVVKLVDEILHRAVEMGASDIHLEETGSQVRVRYRVDGLLRRAGHLPAASRQAVLSRIKVMAGMDISVRRRAQDGRIAHSHGERSLTLRVSTLPVNGGEKAVVRILDPESAPDSLDALGLASEDDVARSLAIQLSLPFVPRPLQADPTARGLVDDGLAHDRPIIPLAASARCIRVAMADPLDLSTLDDLQFQTGRRVDPVVASPGAVLEALGLREGSGLDQLVASLPEELRAERDLEGRDLERATRAAPW
jgi:hypothetical protein